MFKIVLLMLLWIIGVSFVLIVFKRTFIKIIGYIKSKIFSFECMITDIMLSFQFSAAGTLLMVAPDDIKSEGASSLLPLGILAGLILIGGIWYFYNKYTMVTYGIYAWTADGRRILTHRGVIMGTPAEVERQLLDIKYNENVLQEHVDRFDATKVTITSEKHHEFSAVKIGFFQPGHYYEIIHNPFTENYGVEFLPFRGTRVDNVYQIRRNFLNETYFHNRKNKYSNCFFIFSFIFMLRSYVIGFFNFPTVVTLIVKIWLAFLKYFNNNYLSFYLSFLIFVKNKVIESIKSKSSFLATIRVVFFTLVSKVLKDIYHKNRNLFLFWEIIVFYTKIISISIFTLFLSTKCVIFIFINPSYFLSINVRFSPHSKSALVIKVKVHRDIYNFYNKNKQLGLRTPAWADGPLLSIGFMSIVKAALHAFFFFSVPCTCTLFISVFSMVQFILIISDLITLYNIFYNVYRRKLSILNKGVRIALRSKVNESVITGLSVVDTILPIGRGQRQLILGDRNTGKTSIFLNTLISSAKINYLGTIDGFGSKRIFGIYVAINQNLSKLVKFIDYLIEFNIHWFSLVLATHASSPAMLGYLLPLVGISIAERLRDRGFDILVCFDDLSKHAKAYRQISLLLGKIPSRDAYPSDIFNVHSSLLERAGKLRLDFFGGSITAFPIIETINSDITEFIATNVISITDGQLYTNRKLFLDGIRPAIDSALSVSRIGSNAQMKFIKVLSAGIKNELTNLRISKDLGTLTLLDTAKLISLESLFSQVYLITNSIEITLLFLLGYKLNNFISHTRDIVFFLIKFYYNTRYFNYILFLSKQNYSIRIFNFLKAFFFLKTNKNIYFLDNLFIYFKNLFSCVRAEIERLKLLIFGKNNLNVLIVPWGGHDHIALTIWYRHRAGLPKNNIARGLDPWCGWKKYKNFDYLINYFDQFDRIDVINCIGYHNEKLIATYYPRIYIKRFNWRQR